MASLVRLALFLAIVLPAFAGTEPNHRILLTPKFVHWVIPYPPVLEHKNEVLSKPDYAAMLKELGENPGVAIFHAYTVHLPPGVRAKSECIREFGYTVDGKEAINVGVTMECKAAEMEGGLIRLTGKAFVREAEPRIEAGRLPEPGESRISTQAFLTREFVFDGQVKPGETLKLMMGDPNLPGGIMMFFLTATHLKYPAAPDMSHHRPVPVTFRASAVALPPGLEPDQLPAPVRPEPEGRPTRESPAFADLLTSPRTARSALLDQPEMELMMEELRRMKGIVEREAGPWTTPPGGAAQLASESFWSGLTCVTFPGHGVLELSINSGWKQGERQFEGLSFVEKLGKEATSRRNEIACLKDGQWLVLPMGGLDPKQPGWLLFLQPVMGTP